MWSLRLRREEFYLTGKYRRGRAFVPHDLPSVCHFSPQLADSCACRLIGHETRGVRMKIVVFALMLICAGCASYVTPGAAVRLQDIDRPDIAAAAARKA